MSRLKLFVAVVLFTISTLPTVAVLADDHAADWPMWRYDSKRTASTTAALPDELHLHWVRELPQPRRAWLPQGDDRDKLEFDLSYSPIVLSDKLFIGSMVDDSLTAYCVNTGEELWKYFADGPVRLSPAGWQGKIYFGSDDGYLYCLDALRRSCCITRRQGSLPGAGTWNR